MVFVNITGRFNAIQKTLASNKWVGRVQHFSLNTTLNFLTKYLSCWMKIVQHDLHIANHRRSCSTFFIEHDKNFSKTNILLYNLTMHFNKFVKQHFYESDWCNFDNINKINELNYE